MSPFAKDEFMHLITQALQESGLVAGFAGPDIDRELAVEQVRGVLLDAAGKAIDRAGEDGKREHFIRGYRRGKQVARDTFIGPLLPRCFVCGSRIDEGHDQSRVGYGDEP